MLGLLGSLGGAAVSAYGASQDRKLQRESLAHQKYMDTHGVQVRMDDLKAAGINPMLAGGMAADGSAHASPVGDGGAGAHIANTSSKVSEMMRAKKESAMLESQTAKNVAEAEEANARAGVESETANNIRLSRPAVIADTAKEVVKAKNEAVAESNWYGRNIRPFVRDVVAVGQTARDVSQAYNSASNRPKSTENYYFNSNKMSKLRGKSK